VVQIPENQNQIHKDKEDKVDKQNQISNLTNLGLKVKMVIGDYNWKRRIKMTDSNLHKILMFLSKMQTKLMLTFQTS